MYSYDNVLRANVMNNNTLGIALMESHNLVVEGNLAADNRREGLLFRDLRHSEIRGNRLERNGNGMFFYSSTENLIENNIGRLDVKYHLLCRQGQCRAGVVEPLLRGIIRQQSFDINVDVKKIANRVFVFVAIQSPENDFAVGKISVVE